MGGRGASEAVDGGVEGGGGAEGKGVGARREGRAIHIDTADYVTQMASV